MKKFTKKSVIQKIIFAVLITALCSIIIPNYVHADITVEPKSGGTLFNPVKNLLTAIGDAFLNLIQSTVFTQDGSKMSAAAEGLTFDVTPGAKARDGGNWWDDSNDNNVAYPGYLYLTPEAIFSNKISILDADFVNPIENYDEYIDGDKYEDGITNLRKTIAKWYVGLRNFALVGLLSVLVYVGIRIILSSTAGEKAKYKQMITYWVSAIALLFVLHYIMSFTFLITDKITQIFGGLNGNKAITTQNVGKEGGDNTFTINDDSGDKTKFSSFLSGEYNDIQGQILSGEKIIGVANLTQYARLYANITGTVGFRYLVVYIALVAYTVYFFFIYTKRVIYLAFLTLIAPLITLTYPIDKLNDGQAQAFNVWIKEFVFNVLLQPFHLLIYTIFIGMAIDFANSNLVYTIVAIAFILPAEKLLRKMFGFDKASTSSAFSGAAAGSMLATAISKAGGKVAGKGGSGGDKGGSGSSGEKPPRTGTETDPYVAYGNEDGNGDNNSEEQLPEGTDNNSTNNNTNSNNNNNTSTTNNSSTNTDDDVPEWRDDLTEQEIADRDNLLNQRTASEAFAEQDRENGDDVSADEMERQAYEQDRQLDRYRQQPTSEQEQTGEKEDEIRQQTEEQEEHQEAQIPQQDQTEGQENEREQPLLQPNQIQNQQQEEQGEQIRQQEQTGEQEGEQEGEQTPEQTQTEEQREQGEQISQPVQQQMQQPAQQQMQELSKKDKISRGLKNVASAVGRKVGDKTGMRKINGFGEMSSKRRVAALGKELWSGAKTIAPKALKAGTRYALAGSAAILAGSAALISGDPKSVLSAATLAGKGGTNIGNRIGDKTVSGITSASNTFMKGYHGEKYDSIKNEQYARQQAYSSETADAMLTAFGQDKQQAAMEAAYEMRLATGVDDNKSIIAALSTTKEFGGDKVKDEDAVELSAAKNMPLMDKYMDDGIFNDYKKYETQKKKISKALQSKHPGINSNQANREAEKALRDYAKYKGKHLAIPGQSDSAEGSGGRRKFRATN